MNNILDGKGKFNSCTGCGMCAAICPKDAIKIVLNKEGFYRPIVDESKCISCGICKKVCYCYAEECNDNLTEKQAECYSAKNRNKKELEEASSGGVSIELMRECIEDGYEVVGVAYDYNEDIAISRTAKSNDEIEAFRGSKYFQSYTVDALREVIKNNNKKYAIFGTPCQIYAVSKFTEIKRCRERFLLIDIFCHGCPTINLWKRYLESYKKSVCKTKFDQIKFRSKTYGWHEYCIDFIYGSKAKHSKKYNDPFFEIFFGKDVMNDVCYGCKLRSSILNTDIRLGDFWGWQYDLDRQGVSAVVCNTDEGKNIFEKVKDKFIIERFNFEDIIKDQTYGKNYTYDKTRREFLLSELQEDKDINDILKKYRKKMSGAYRIKVVLKNLFKRCGGRLYLIMRQKKHKDNSK